MFTAVLAVAVGASIGLGVSFLIPISLIAFPILVWLTLTRLEIFITVLILTFVAAASGNAQVSSAAELGRWVVLLLGIGGFAIRWLTEGSKSSAGRVTTTRIDAWWFLISLLLWAIASAAWSITPALSLGRSFSFLLLIAISMMAIVLGITSYSFLRCLNALAIISVLVGWVTLITSHGGGEFAGVFGNPNFLGALNAMLVVPAAGLALRSSGFKRSLQTFTTLSLFFHVALSGSRGALVASIAGLIYLFLGPSRSSLRLRGRYLIGFVVALGVVGVVMVRSSFQGFFEETGRGPIWRTFGEVFPQSPVVGHGFGSTEALLARYGAFTGVEGAVNYHNSYLNLLSDLGIVGGVLFLLFIIRLASSTRRSERDLGGVVLAGAVGAVVESYLFSVGSGLSIIFWFAAMLMLARRSKPIPGYAVERNGVESEDMSTLTNDPIPR